MPTVVRSAEASRSSVAGFSPTAGPSARLVAGVCGAAVVAACIISPDAVEHGPVLCPFRLATGLPCPGCGLTRSWVFVVHGRWGDSLVANPFGIVALAVALVFIVATGRAVLRRRPPPAFGRVFAGWVPRLLIVAWVAFGAGRLILAAVG